MLNLIGYEIKEEIFKSSNSAVYRATQTADNRPVVIKLLNREYPSSRELSAFVREYEIMAKLSGEGIIKAYSLIKCSNSLAIIMEDIGGESVAKVLRSTKAGLAEKVSLAIRMTDSLIQTHRQNVIHKDVNPTNFVWNEKTNQVKIIDFGISAELIRELPQSIDMNVPEGNLRYASPEQTGRISRPVDYRSDLYSLGITFYELFTGRLPYTGEDDSEIVYGHIAKTPIPPKDINPEIPYALSRIVMKMISKTAEERYQSAAGIKRDLEFCLQMMDKSTEMEWFVPGENDVSDRFEIPGRLYGREEEIRVLLEGLERASGGSCELLLVGGFPGIGKTSLIQEIRKPVIGEKGYFISGKCNRLERNVPYYCLIQAFKGLVRQLLSESQSKLESWKRRILEALGRNGRIIIDIIPELEQIVGPQPDVPEINPLESQNRFHIVFLEFIKAFAAVGHPLVIFLDDLQWSDISTIDLLKFILGEGNASYIYIIGAYRDSELQEGNPLLKLLQLMDYSRKETEWSYNHMTLLPLNKTAVSRLLADTLHSSAEEIAPLTDLVCRKTMGNPFFINKLLKTLYSQGSFTFLPEKGKWAYSIEKADQAEISDNVVELLVRGLELMPEGVLDSLKLAACIGNQFNLALLSQISDKPLDELGSDLWTAIENELILPLNENYRLLKTFKSVSLPKDFDARFCFAHDRIRQAVQSLISRTERNEIHLAIGRAYLKEFGETGKSEIIFDLVNHLNLGRTLIRREKERSELSDLNAIAGDKAKKSGAFAVASGFFDMAESVLSEEEWERRPGKLFDIKLKHATCALLSGDLQKADMLCDQLSGIAASNIDRAAISNVRVQIHEFRGNFFDAIDEIRRGLRLFGITLPDNDKEIGLKTREGIGKMVDFLSRTSVEDIVNLPEMREPEKVMVMQLLYQVVPPALQTNPPLYILASLMMFEMTCAYGVSPLACKCLTDCGIVLSTMNQFQTSYKLGQAAFMLVDRFNAESMKSSVYFGYTFSSYLVAHYEESIRYYDMSYRKGLETGDIQHAAYALSHKLHMLMWAGKNLRELKQELEEAIAILGRARTAMPLLLTRIVNYTVDRLQSVPEDENTEKASEHNMLAAIENAKDVCFLFRFSQYNTFVNLLMDNMESAERWYDMEVRYFGAAMCDFPVPDHYLLGAFIAVGKWERASEKEKQEIKDTLTDAERKMRVWVENCPDNFAHKYYLLLAETAIINGEPLETIIDLFRKALDSIKTNDFIQYRAFINERVGEFWLSKGEEITGKAYIREAEYLYRQWGAHRKSALLRKRYYNFFMNDPELPDTRETITKATGTSLDVISILKSTQAISSEIKIDKLLKILIRTIIENAGAQRGCLLLRNESDGRFYIEAMQDVSSNQLQAMISLPFEECGSICQEIVQYVARTGETVVVHNACEDDDYQDNAYIAKNNVRSLLCMPVIYQCRLKGIVYLENNLSGNVFTAKRLEILKVLSSQASISIENAMLYEKMEEMVKERTAQLNKANEKLRELSFRDPLTDLYNRRYTYEHIFGKISQFTMGRKKPADSDEGRDLSPENNVVGLLLIDIDYFKEVNDTYGHSAGDSALVTIARILKQMIGPDDFIIRWGGEEFLIVLFDTGADYLERFCRNVLETVSATPLPVSKNKTVYKTCSIGYVRIPLSLSNPEHMSLTQIMQIVDYALYCAKENGRNCAACFRMIKEMGSSGELYEELQNLSKNTRLNEEYFEIDYIRL